MEETVGAHNVETKTRVFISYSRKDMAFANRFEAALKARGFDVLIDREEIYAFEDWWKRIQSLIGQSDTVVVNAENLCQRGCGPARIWAERHIR